LSSKLWNELSYARRRMFFETKSVDLKGTYKEFYEKYKTLIGSATAQQVLNKNDEAWRSFFSLLKAKKEGRLPPFMKRVNPPSYRKRGGRRVLWTVLRNDQYKIDGDYIVIKGLGAIGSLKVRFSGRIHIIGMQGRAEIHYDSDEEKWYIHISFDVEEKMVGGRRVRVPMKPLGDKVAGVDIGINNLLAIYVDDGSAMLVRGRHLKSMSFYWRNRIARYQSTLNRYGLNTSKRLRRMYKKWRKQVKSCIDWAVRNAIEWLHYKGVGRIIVGYPKYIAQEPNKNSKANFEVVHAWSYGYLLRRLKEVAEEYGIEVEYVDERDTSRTCPICRTHIGHKRISQGIAEVLQTQQSVQRRFSGSIQHTLEDKIHSPEPRPKRGRGNAPETRRGAEPSFRWECSPKPLRSKGNPRPLGRGGGQTNRCICWIHI